MDVRLPNGVIIRGVPEGTNKWSVVEKAISGGYAKPEDFGQESANPATGMSGIEKFGAGYGKAAVDIGRGIGQTVGLTSRADIQNARERDSALMETGAGRAGNIAGTLLDLAPTAAIPGANTLAGAAAIGGGLGFMQPSASTGETFANTGIGAVAAPASLIAARGLGSLYNAGKSSLEPLFKGGQDRVAASTLINFAGGRNEAIDALRNIQGGSSNTLKGYQPTTAELAQNAGLSQLERTVGNNPQVTTAMGKISQSNREALVSALDDVVGQQTDRHWMESARNQVASGFYNSARGTTVNADKQLLALLERPSLSGAWERASSLAAENGVQLAPLQKGRFISGNTLHYLKMAMDDVADSPAATSGIGRNEQRAIASSRNELVNWMESNIPDYKLGRENYAKMSRPLNQMDVMQAIRDKLVPALNDFGPSSKMRPEAFAQALRHGDVTAANALDRSNASISDVLNPLQLDNLNRIAGNLSARGNADQLGKALGSNTAQNLVSQNFLRQTLGPLGLPQSMLERAASSTIGRSMLRPVQFMGSIGEDEIMNRLARATLDPMEADRLLQIGLSRNPPGTLPGQSLGVPISAAAERLSNALSGPSN